MKAFFVAIAIFIVGTAIVRAEEPKSETRSFVDTSHYRVVNDKTIPPVFDYSGPRGHHGQRISKQPIESVIAWADGTIAWQVMKDGDWYPDGWYHSTIPAEKVEKAVQAIVESFGKYPVKNRPHDEAIWFRLGVNYSPHIRVMAPDLYEDLWMDDFLLRHYIEKRGDFQSGDEEKMIHAMMELNGPFVKFTGIIDHYREHISDAGLAPKGEKKYSDEEVKKCAELFAADAEHLLLMEKQVLDLVPSHEGLTPKDRDYKSQDVKVEQETTDGQKPTKRRFIYSLITEEERKEIWEELNRRREKAIQE